ncbi:MAG: hypothetical protein K0S34_261 [Bacillales bacterium]|jgi:hypothetical protein|nr:hypothetical protein [Bacillales bacterium]
MKKAISIIVILVITIFTQLDTQTFAADNEANSIVIYPESDKKPFDL